MGRYSYSPAGHYSSAWQNSFFMVLSVVLVGYAVMGRGFAYLGVAPIYVGEIAALSGAAAVLFSGSLPFTRYVPLKNLIIGLIAWGLICTIPYFGTYSWDALRDFVIVGYAGFALVVATLLIQDPARLKTLLVRYRTFIVIFAATIWLVRVIQPLPGFVPSAPWGDVGIVEVKAGDTAVHVAGCLVFLLVGMMRPKLWMVGLLLFVLLTVNRAGLLAATSAIVIYLIFRPYAVEVYRFAYGVTCVLLFLFLFNVSFTIADREVSADLLFTKFESIFVESEHSLEGTKQWRIDWWERIIDYTVHGPYFWTGKGYGINLANDDGFQVRSGDLRSPHNSHLTVLARSGVPGFVLWVVLHIAWLLLMLRHYMRASRESDWEWSGIFLFIIAYWCAFMINAGFDVVLESPQAGIWFWTLAGVGLGAAHIHEHEPDAIRD